MKKSILLLSMLGICGNAYAGDDKKKHDLAEFDANRDRVAWKLAVPAMGYGVLKACAPQAITKAVSFMPCVVTKYGASAIAFSAPYLIPTLGVILAYFIATDMNKNWEDDKKAWYAAQNAGVASKKSEGVGHDHLAATPEELKKINIRFWYASLCAHTGRNLKNLSVPVVGALQGLGYLF